MMTDYGVSGYILVPSIMSPLSRLLFPFLFLFPLVSWYWMRLFWVELGIRLLESPGSPVRELTGV